MKRLLMATTLACVLSGTALAGDMPGVDVAAPSGGTQSKAIVSVIITILSIIGK